MPFGAAVEDGAVRFRLWAPGARTVAVVLGAGGERTQVLTSIENHWFEASVPDVGAGTRYAFRIDGTSTVADPASRANPDGVHAASAVFDPAAYDWREERWRGRPWEEAVIYEMHVGTFTPEGSFAATIERLPALAELGITAIELMPVAAFPGRRNWGYDAVLPFAPAAAYGPPDDLKRLVDAAHGCGLMVMLDVVYNHFGPEGNYLHVYAPQFFNAHHQTPWGAAINFDAAHSRTVRDFFIHNALYWIDEYQFDGLRIDAVHAIVDESSPDIVTELTAAVRQHAGSGRHVHIVLENDRNEAWRLTPDRTTRPHNATAQWNDDLHHALHVLVTGERDGYYADYAERPLWQLGRCLAEGFAFQGEASPFRDGAARGERSAHIAPGAFVSYTQTHDQIGNRAFGERLTTLTDTRALRTAAACTLLAPATPMLFMGEEYGATTPFLFFCDFGAELAEAVTRGRRAEFGIFDRIREADARATIPDPNSPATFAASKLNQDEAATSAATEWRAFYHRCLALRRTYVTPRLLGSAPAGSFAIEQGVLLRVRWRCSDGSTLHLGVTFSPTALQQIDALPGLTIYESAPGIGAGGVWPAYGVAYSVQEPA